ncbi:MAG: hypothetical protein AAF555_08515 [Verrucomicrobiota bacterium]
MPETHRNYELPESLQRQLADVRGQLWRTKIAEAILAGSAGLLCSFLLVFVLDRLGDTGGPLRLAVLLAGTLLFAVFAPYWLRKWVWGHRRSAQLARLVRRRYPRFGDRLLGVVELRDQDAESGRMSPALMAAAMKQVAEDSAKRDLQEAVPNRHTRRLAIGAFGLAGLAILVFAVVPSAGWNSLQRWLLPLAEVERYTFTILDDVPERLPVIHGEAFDLEFALAEDSAWQPETADLELPGPQGALRSQLVAEGYRFQLPGQTEEGTLRLRVGDGEWAIRVVPLRRPALQKLAATLTYPDYLQYAPETRDLRDGLLTVVEGSRFALSGQSTRPLRSASLTLTPEPESLFSLPGAEAPPEAKEPTTHPLKIVKREGFQSATLLAEESASYQIDWVDAEGLSPRSGFRGRLRALADEKPQVYINGLSSVSGILEEEVLKFTVTASDDFGVRRIGLEWQGRADGEVETARGDELLVDGAPKERKISDEASFSPSALGIGPQRVQVRAYVEDYLPDRERVYSETYTIFVLDRDQHARLIKQQFDRILGALEEAARTEESNYEANLDLQDLAAEELSEEEAKQMLAEQAEREKLNAERLKELEKASQELFQDALRNPDIDPKSMQKWLEMMKSLKELGEQDLPEVEQKLAESSEQSEGEAAKEELQEAIEKQEAALEKMKETLAQANEAAERLEAGTFVARLRKAARAQDRIGNSLVKSIETLDIAGLEFADMKGRARKLMGELDESQLKNREEVRYIQEDLGHFFRRTSQEKYETLQQAMDDSEIVDGLDDVRRLLLRNNSFLSLASSREWAALLREWADTLDPNSGQNAGGGGGAGGGGMSEDMEEQFELMLRLMRLVRQQEDLRGRTRAIEENKLQLQEKRAQ